MAEGLDSSLLSLPWETQLTLASGYAAYGLAYIGVKSQHRTIDIAFRTLVFGAIATGLLYAAPYSGVAESWRIVLAVLVPLLAAAIWRLGGRRLVRWTLQTCRFSYADDEDSPLDRLSMHTAHQITQIEVTLDDGRVLGCDDTSRFKKSVMGPLVIGPDGSLGFHVTHTSYKNEDGKFITTDRLGVADGAWGDDWTVIPADRIVDTRLRLRRV